MITKHDTIGLLAEVLEFWSKKPEERTEMPEEWRERLKDYPEMSEEWRERLKESLEMLEEWNKKLDTFAECNTSSKDALNDWDSDIVFDESTFISEYDKEVKRQIAFIDEANKKLEDRLLLSSYKNIKNGIYSIFNNMTSDDEKVMM